MKLILRLAVASIEEDRKDDTRVIIITIYAETV